MTGWTRLPYLRNKLDNTGTPARWGQETSPIHHPLQHLQPDERALYEDLVHNRYGQQLRLEQERIAFYHLQR